MADEDDVSRPRLSYSQGVWVESRFVDLQRGHVKQPNGSIYYINWKEKYVDVIFHNQDGTTYIEAFEFYYFTEYRGRLNSWMIYDL